MASTTASRSRSVPTPPTTTAGIRRKAVARCSTSGSTASAQRSNSGGRTPEVIEVERLIAPSGVDASTVADLAWPGGRQARIVCSFVDDEHQQASFHGADGMLMLERVAFTSGDPLDHVVVRSSKSRDEQRPIDLQLHAEPSSMTDGSLVEQFSVQPGDPYQGMVEAFAACRSRQCGMAPPGRAFHRTAGAARSHRPARRPPT